MKYDENKVDEMTLALLFLVTSGRQPGLGARAGRGFDLGTIKRLYEKGWLKDPGIKALSLYLTETGFKKSEELFTKHFCQLEN